MRRINTPNRQPNLFGTGKDGFRNANLAGGINATENDAGWMNDVQEELAKIIESTGGTLDPTNNCQVLAAIQQMIAAVGSAEVGKLGLFKMTVAPTGWLELNGAAIPAATFANLTTAIYCGDAANATADCCYRCTDPLKPNATRSITGAYLVMPDMRGEFPRGWDDGRGVDAGRSLWNWQADQLEDHTHTTSNGTPQPSNPWYQYSGVYNPTGLGGPDTGIPNSGNHGVETRPRNVAWLACIKY